MTQEFYNTLVRGKKYYIIEVTTPVTSQDLEDDVLVHFTTDTNVVDNFSLDAKENKKFNIRIFSNTTEGVGYINELQHLSSMNLVGWVCKA